MPLLQNDKLNKFIFLLLITISSAFITGCSKKEKEIEICKLKFAWWGSSARNEYTMEGIKHFRELYPEIHLKAEFTDWTTYEHNFDFMKKLADDNVIYPSAIGLELSIVKSQKTAGAFLWCNESSKLSIFLNYLLNDKDFALMQKNERGVPASNTSLTPLMENNQLQSLQYTALMKLRFQSRKISTMLPIMEDKRVIKVFPDNVFDYVEGRKTCAEAARSFYSAVK